MVQMNALQQALSSLSNVTYSEEFHFLMECTKYEFRRDVMPTHAQVPMYPDRRSSVRSYAVKYSQRVTAQTQYILIMEYILLTARRSFLYVLPFVFSKSTGTCHDGAKTGENTANSPPDQCYVFNECHRLSCYVPVSVHVVFCRQSSGK